MQEHWGRRADVELRVIILEIIKLIIVRKVRIRKQTNSNVNNSVKKPSWYTLKRGKEAQWINYWFINNLERVWVKIKTRLRCVIR